MRRLSLATTLASKYRLNGGIEKANGLAAVPQPSLFHASAKYYRNVQVAMIGAGST